MVGHKQLVVDPAWCKGCGICVAFCPKQALEFVNGKARVCASKACVFCGQCEMRLAGSGGQGVIVASVILAEAAVVSGLQVTQSQSYGSEVRGGIYRAEVILSRDRIWYTRVGQPDFLLTLTQASLEKFGRELAPHALVMIDDSLALPDWLDPGQVLAVPILRTAREKIGERFTANIVAIGALNTALDLFDWESLLEGVRRHIPPGTEAFNQRALEEGATLIRKIPDFFFL